MQKKKKILKLKLLLEAVESRQELKLALQSWLLLYYCRVPQAILTCTVHPGSFDSFVRPPTCTARNFQPGKIYGAPTNRVNPVLSPGAFFVKIITSIYSSVGPSLLAPTFCVYLNNQCTLKAPSCNERRHQFYWAQ